MITRNGRQVGVGEPETVTPPQSHPSPWSVALVTSVIGAATGWIIEELVVPNFSEKRRRRR